MSASERLGALDEAMTNGPWDNAGWHVHAGSRFTDTHQPLAATFGDSEADARGIATLRNALPQIRALVQAAETIARPAPGTSAPILPLAAALANLDAKLVNE